MTKGAEEPHAFISYVRENGAEVDRLEAMLEGAGIKVWRDTKDLWPGEDWRIKIREAITSNALVFIACFSDESASRPTSYQNEELVIAVDEFRKRPPGQTWLIPVRFGDCTLPQFDLGAGRTLDSLQRVDLWGDGWDEGAGRLLTSVFRALEALNPTEARNALPTPPTESPADYVKARLLDGARQIELDEGVMGHAARVAESLQDEALFPTWSDELNVNVKGLRFLVAQVWRYWTHIDELLSALITGCAWGHENHHDTWKRAVSAVASTAREGVRNGNELLLDLRLFPLLPLLYGCSLAGLARGNFGAIKAVAIDTPVRRRYGDVPLVGVDIWRPFEHTPVTAQAVARFDPSEQLSDEDLGSLLDGSREGLYAPVSGHLHAHLRPYFRHLVFDDEDYTRTFDRMEILLGALSTDLLLQSEIKQSSQQSGPYVDAPSYGAFTWRNPFAPIAIEEEVQMEAVEQGDSWGPVAAGLFGGSVERATNALEVFVEGARTARQRRH